MVVERDDQERKAHGGEQYEGRGAPLTQVGSEKRRAENHGAGPEGAVGHRESAMVLRLSPEGHINALVCT